MEDIIATKRNGQMVVRLHVDHKILTINDHRVTLEQPYYDENKVIVLADRVLVRMEATEYEKGDPNIQRNIICVDSVGQVKWRIEPTETTLVSGEPSNYDSMWLDGSGKVFVMFHPDIRAHIDLETGKLKDLESWRA